MSECGLVNPRRGLGEERLHCNDVIGIRFGSSPREATKKLGVRDCNTTRVNHAGAEIEIWEQHQKQCNWMMIVIIIIIMTCNIVTERCH